MRGEPPKTGEPSPHRLQGTTQQKVKGSQGTQVDGSTVKKEEIEMIKGIVQEVVDQVPSGTESLRVQVHRSGVNPESEIQETADEEDIPWCVVCCDEESKDNPLSEVLLGDTPEDIPCWMCRRCRQRGTSPAGWSGF